MKESTHFPNSFHSEDEVVPFNKVVKIDVSGEDLYVYYGTHPADFIDADKAQLEGYKAWLKYSCTAIN